MTSDQRPRPPRAATVLPPLDGGPSRDVHGARAYVVDRVAQLASVGALDAGNGDVLDAWLERLREKWHAHHATERSRRIGAAEARLGALEAEVVVADQRAAAAAAELQHTQRLLDEYERQFLEPVESRPNDRPERRRRPRATVDPLEGIVRPWAHSVVITVLVLLAIAGDLATFNLTLSATFRESGPWILWTLTVAFAAASVGLMHGVGRSLKNLRSARGGLGWLAIGLMVSAWLALGAVAVFFRMEPPSADAAPAASIFDTDVVATAAAADHRALLEAILLAGLFLASGVLAFYAGFSEHHPQMTDYRGLRRRLPKQRKAAATTAGVAVTARQALEHTRAEADRAERSAADGIAAADAEIAELKELVRVEVAGHLGMPAATNGLTTGRLETGDAGGDDGDDLIGNDDVIDHPPVLPTPRPESAAPEPVAGGAVEEARLWGVSTADFPTVGPLQADGHNGHGALNGSH